MRFAARRLGSRSPGSGPSTASGESAPRLTGGCGRLEKHRVRGGNGRAEGARDQQQGRTGPVAWVTDQPVPAWPKGQAAV